MGYNYQRFDFDVKSVGTVILGIIKSGTVKKHDKVLVEPLGKEVMIKGIQSQDRDFDSAEAGMRVGLNLKGVEADELKENDQVFVSSGLQAIAAKVKSVDPLEVETENPVAYNKDTKFLIASTKQDLPRIIGSAHL